jgi:hypothetical protein
MVEQAARPVADTRISSQKARAMGDPEIGKSFMMKSGKSSWTKRMGDKVQQGLVGVMNPHAPSMLAAAVAMRISFIRFL